MRVALTIVIALSLAACGSADPASDAGRDAGRDSGDALSDAGTDASSPADAGTDAGGEPDDGGLDGGGETTVAFDLDLGTYPSGTEATRCVVVDAGGASGRRLASIEVSGGAHVYAILVRRTETSPTTEPIACGSGSSFEPVLVAGDEPAHLVLPDDTELVLEPGERLEIAVSAANASDTAADVSARLALVAVPASAPARSPVTVGFAFDAELFAPAGATVEETSFHAVPAGTELIALATQTHSRGVASVRRATSATDTTGALLHDASAGTVSTLDAPIVLDAGEGLRLSCTITNETTTPIVFGDGSGDEICLLLYYAR